MLLKSSDWCEKIVIVFDKVWKWWNKETECGVCKCCELRNKKK